MTLTLEEKAAKYDRIAAALWNMAYNGNMLQSTVSAGLIQHFEIEGPRGEAPEEC